MSGALRVVAENRYLLTGWFWIAAAVPTLLWLKDSVLWVALMSLYANAATGFAANEAGRARKNSESGLQD